MQVTQQDTRATLGHKWQLSAQCTAHTQPPCISRNTCITLGQQWQLCERMKMYRLRPTLGHASHSTRYMYKLGQQWQLTGQCTAHTQPHRACKSLNRIHGHCPSQYSIFHMTSILILGPQRGTECYRDHLTSIVRVPSHTQSVLGPQCGCECLKTTWNSSFVTFQWF